MNAKPTRLKWVSTTRLCAEAHRMRARLAALSVVLVAAQALAQSPPAAESQQPTESTSVSAGGASPLPTSGPPTPAPTATALPDPAPALPPAQAPALAPNLQQAVDWLRLPGNAAACELLQLGEFEGLIYVACGHGGLWLLRAGTPPTLVDVRSLGGRVVLLSERAGRLIAQVQRTEEYTVAQRSFAVPPATPAPPARPEEFGKSSGRVERRRGNRVLVDLGRDDGLRRDDRLQFLDPSPKYSWPQMLYPVLGVGRVLSVDQTNAVVEVGVNEIIPEGSYAQRTLLPLSASLVSPPRPPAPVQLSVLLRPLLSTDGAGGGLLLDATASYRFKSPLQLSVALSPFGVGVDRGESAFTFTGFVLASYDTRYFEAGMGVGVQTMNELPLRRPGTGTVLPLLARLGATDGLNLRLRSDLNMIYRDVELGALRVDAQVPLRRGLWLEFGGAGGYAGYLLGEFGVRRQFSGNGEPGSTYLTLSAGFASISRQRCAQIFDDAFGNSLDCQDGPAASGIHLGLGFERRF